VLTLALVLALSAQAGTVPPEPQTAARAFARELVAADTVERARLLILRADESGPELVTALFAEAADRRRTGDLTRALAAYEIARGVADERALALPGAQARRDAAYVLSVFGRYNEAADHVEQALTTYRRLGERVLEARATINLGILARYRGDQDAALAAYATARDLATAAGDARIAVVALNNTSVVYLNRGHLSAAQAALEDALQRQGGTRDQLTADILGNLGSVYQSQGQLELAREYLTRSIDLQEELGNTFATMHEREALGSVLLLLGLPEEGQRLLEHVAERAEQGGAQAPAAQARAGLGRILLAQGRAEEAAVQLRRAVALARNAGADVLALVLADLAQVESARGRPAAALAAADEVVSIAERLASRSRLGLGEGARGTALSALGRDDEAAAAFERSIRAAEEDRDEVAGAPAERQRFLEWRMEPYEGLLKLYARRGRAEAALAQAERARARVLLDALHGGQSRLDGMLTPEEVARQRELREALARAGVEASRAEGDAASLRAAEEKRHDARLAYEAFRAAAYASHPGMAARSGRAAPWRLEDAQALLDERTLAVTYAVTPDRTYLFALTRKGLALHEVALGRTALEGRTRGFRAALADRRLDVAALGRALCTDLLGPVRKQLDASKRLLIVPDGPLWELPFQALKCTKSRYLLEERAIAYAPSLTALREMAARRAPPVKARDTLLAVGDPSFGEPQRRQIAGLLRDGALGPLPDAAAEVRAIERFYAPGSSVYVGADASETRVKTEARRHRVLHFAAHGILNDASPLYSQLVLARPGAAETDDGLLEAWEIMEMSLPADLAVLSACETGRGRVSQGEGLVGLSWAFSVAGCPTTIVSQWKVDSRSTSRLMRRFHRDLADGRPTADALRAAALAVKADPLYAHPFYWAGFVVMGPGWTSRAPR
jgi:CHAT domain-containing protein/tetratricopeptide (TPR) repeat protein